MLKSFTPGFASQYKIAIFDLEFGPGIKFWPFVPAAGRNSGIKFGIKWVMSPNFYTFTPAAGDALILPLQLL